LLIKDKAVKLEDENTALSFDVQQLRDHIELLESQPPPPPPPVELDEPATPSDDKPADKVA